MNKKMLRASLIVAIPILILLLISLTLTYDPVLRALSLFLFFIILIWMSVTAISNLTLMAPSLIRTE